MTDRPGSQSVKFHGGAAMAVAIGAVAMGAVAIGALAIGALSIRRLAIRGVAIDRAELKSLTIENLTVGRLQATDFGPPLGASEAQRSLRTDAPDHDGTTIAERAFDDDGSS
jgi:hypothetical protein